jgi:probable lipoprotein NlpC
MLKLRFSFIFLLSVLILSSCKSRKHTLNKDAGALDKPRYSLVEKYAQLLNVPKSNIKNAKLYEFVDNWMGTPYRLGGLDHNGVDCSGFTSLLQRQVYGINIPRMTSQQVGVIKRKYEKELKEGDLVFFDFDGKKFSHVGVYLQNDYVVHASTRKGVMIVKLTDPAMYKYFSRAGSVNL